MEGEALATLVLNKLRGTFTCVAVKAPGFGDRRKAMLQDIAILTGGQVITEELGLELKEATIDMLGSARQVKVDKENTVIVEGAGDPERDQGPHRSPSAPRSKRPPRDYDREKLQERLAKLAGGVAVINVGAATEVEMKERKLRIEDALAATRAAVEEGIVPGGGTALIDASKAVAKLLAQTNGDVKTGVAHRAARAGGARAPDRGERGRGRLRRSWRRSRAKKSNTFGYDAAKNELWRHDRARHHRPDQGHPQRAAERGQRGGHGAHHRVARQRPAGEESAGSGSAGRRHGRHVLRIIHCSIGGLSQTRQPFSL